MRLFAGLDHTDYQDVLRALGRHLDTAGSRDIRLIEQETGLTVQYRPAADLARGFQTLRVSDEELVALLRRAYQSRGKGRQPGGPANGLGLPYQEVLRAVGRVLDAEGLRDLRLVEQPHGMLIQVTQAGQRRREYRTYRLGTAQVRMLVRIATEQHETGSFGPPVA